MILSRDHKKNSGWTRTLLLAALVALAALAAWSNSFYGAFVLDDHPTITLNPAVRDLTVLTQLGRLPLAASTYSRPLAHLSFALNFAAGGLNPVGYHAVNLTIHILAGLALLGLTRRTLRSAPLRGTFSDHADWLALSVALLWALHPLQTGAITYVTQRTEALAALFYLSALYAFARSVEAGARERLWRGLAIAACFAGVASKETTATLPLLVFLYDRTFAAGTFRAAWEKRRGFYLALASAWVLQAALIYRAGSMGGTALEVEGYTPLSYLAVQFKAVATYLRLAFWPAPLVFDYGRGLHLAWASAAPYAAVVLALAAATVYALRRHPAAGFCGTLFFAVLAPTSSVLPIADPIFEHRAYLPLAAVVALAVCGAAYLWGRWKGAAAKPWPVYAAALVLAPALALATHARNVDYRTEFALWSDAYAKNPANPRAAATLGSLLNKEGKFEEAERRFREALALDPADGDHELGLGLAQLKLGKLAEAKTHLEAALAREPDDPNAQHGLGFVLLATGERGRGLGLYARAANGMNYDTEFCLNIARELWNFGLNAQAAEFARFLLAEATRSGDPTRIALFSSFLGELGAAEVPGGK